MTVSMSPYDQLLLELINRARADPTAEAARYGIDLDQGLAAGTISAAAKQPLAPNQILIDTAGAHTQDMLDNNYISHTDLLGQSPSDRARAAGYPTGVGENISWGGTTGPVNQIQHVYARHQGLFLSAGHRKNVLGDSYEEVGVGVRFGPYTYSGITYNSSMVTEMFGNPGINPVITGVVFTDASDGSANDDNFYSIGEQVTSGTITATNASTGAVFTTSIGTSGGYALPVVAGTYNVVATAGGHSYLVSSVVVGSANFKVDFETTTASSASNLPPSLQPIADVQFALTQSTFSTNLAATDLDSNQLTFSATVQNLAYYLDQTLGLTDNANVQDNWGGLGEKWLQGQNGKSYYITPFGELFEWDGSGPGSLSGELVATLLPEYHADVGLLHAAQPGMNGVVATVSGNNLNLTMNSSVSGTFIVIATVSDGISTDTETFHATKGYRISHHNPAEDFEPASGSMLKVDALVGQAWQEDKSSQGHRVPTMGWIGNLRGDFTGIAHSSARTVNTKHHHASWQDQGVRCNIRHEQFGSDATKQDFHATKRFINTSAGSHENGDEPIHPSVGVSTFGNQMTMTDDFRLLDEVFSGWN